MKAGLLMCAATALAFSQAAVTPIPSYKSLKFPPLKAVKIPNPEVYTLGNGLKVYLLEDHELPLVSGFALVRTGNLFDPADKRGLADVTGTLLRSGGTKAKTGDQIDQELENLAASIESNIGEERGSVSFSCLKEDTATVMSLFRDFLSDAEFRQDKLDLAKTQIRSAIARRNDDPAGIAGREFQSVIYGRDNPYGWTIEYEHIDNIQRDDLVRFYKRYFFPANLTLAVYGDFSTPEMKKRLEELFGSWNYTQPEVPKFPPMQARPAPGVFLADKPDVTQTFFEIGHLGGLLSDKDYPALQVAADILGSGFSSRLMRKVRTELGYAYSIGGSWGAGYLHPGVFQISGSTKSASTAETIDVIRQEVEKLRSAEVTEVELKTAKDTVLNGFVFFFDTPAKTLNRLVTYDYFGYPRDFIFQYQKAIENVTRADVLRVAKQYLKPDSLSIVAVGNPKEFGKPLASLNVPVNSIDLTIPEPKREAVKSDASTQARGRELMAAARKAVGGAEKIRAVTDMTRIAEGTFSAGGGQMKVKQVTRVIEPATMRQDQELPFGKISVFFDGKAGWIVTPQGSQPLPPPVVEQARGEIFRELPGLLLNENVNAAGEDSVEITGEGGLVTRLYVDPKTGLPAKQVYRSAEMGGPPQTVEEAYGDWRETGGLKLPFRVTIKQAGQPFAEVGVTDWKINTGLKPEELSKKP